jgi:anthranilate phosphoribosyltransferase
MRVKEETVDEIIGFARGARAVMRPMPRPKVTGLVDLALPYDGKASKLQTGVAAALVAAASGVPILLHCADDVPAKKGVGPLNLLRALGYPVDQSAEMVSASIEVSNFSVLNIDQIFPEWTALTPIRHHFGLRTLMNTTEKLFNPGQAEIHISGFYHGSYLNRLAAALPGTERNWIVQGEEGSIDIRPGKKTRVYVAQGDEMVETMIDARDYGYDNETPLEMPNDATAHAAVIRDVLAGVPGPACDQVALTAAVLLWMTGQATSIAVGIDTACQTLNTGQALALLKLTSQMI